MFVEQDLSQGVYVIRRSEGAGDVLLDGGRLAKDEARLAEVAFVTQEKIQELLSHTNDSWHRCSKSLTYLTREESLTERALRDAKDLALLALTDKVLKDRGFDKGSKEIREAIVRQDKEVRLYESRLIEIQAVKSLARGAAEQFHKAHQSLRELHNKAWPSAAPSTPREEPAFQRPSPPVSIPDNFFDEEDEPLPPGFRAPTYR